MTNGGFQLSEWDIDILTHIHRLRLAQINHIALITNRSPKRITNRLLQMTKRTYLYRRRFPFQPFIYTINKNAVPILVERGVAPKHTLEARVRLGELTELFLRHTLMITDIHAILARACQDTNITLSDWQEGKSIWDDVTFTESGATQRLPVQPDAFFTLGDPKNPKNQMHFFLEADRSTATHKRFQQKLTAYLRYHQQGRHTAKYGITSFRVITITPTLKRAENLCATASTLLPKGISKFYYFTPLLDDYFMNPIRIFDDIFISPRDYTRGVHYRLFPHLAPTPLPTYTKPEGTLTPTTPSRAALSRI